MKDAKINRNRAALTDQQISDVANFDGLLEQYNKVKPTDQGRSGGGNSNWPMWTAIVLGVAAFSTMFYLSSKVEHEQELVAQPFIHPPVKGVNVELAQYSIPSNELQVLHYGETKIEIPVNAFLDSAGHPVQGKIDLFYREFHDVAEIFLSGIPMQYDSADTQYHFESAGMFEIRAFQQEKEVFVNSEAPIVVKMQSRNAGNYFNKYYLDEASENWNYLEKDVAILPQTNGDSSVVSDVEQILERTNELKHSIATIKKMKPIVPPVADPNKFSIKIGFEKDEFPELAMYEEVLFEITDDNENFQPEDAARDWDDVELRKGAKGRYELTFYDNHQPFTYIVKPVLQGAALEQAMANFEAKFAAYETRYSDRLEQEEAELKALAQETRRLTDSLNTLNYTMDSATQARLSQQLLEDRVTREFTVDQFGIYNSDCPHNLPQGQPMAIQHFVNRENEKDTLLHNGIYIAEQPTNRLFHLLPGFNMEQFQFNPKSKTILWMITQEEKLAVFYPEDFKDDQAFNEGTIQMRVLDRPVNADHVRQMLRMNEGTKVVTY